MFFKIILILFGFISIINGLTRSEENEKLENFNEFLKKIKDDFDKDPNCPDCKLNGQYHIVKLNKEHRILNLWSSVKNESHENEQIAPNNSEGVQLIEKNSSIDETPSKHPINHDEKQPIHKTLTNYPPKHDRKSSDEKSSIDEIPINYHSASEVEHSKYPPHKERKVNKNESQLEDCTEEKSESTIDNCSSIEDYLNTEIDLKDQKKENNNKPKYETIDFYDPKFAGSHIFYTKWKMSH